MTPEVNMEVYEEVDAKEAEAYKEDAEEYEEDGGTRRKSLIARN